MSHVNGTPAEPVIESNAEETSSEPLPPPPSAGVALTPRPPAEREVLTPLDPEQVVEGMRQYQRLLRDLLEPSDWQAEDKHGRPLDRPFLKKSGWRKIARAFNLSFERVHSRVEREEDVTPVRAEVWIRAVAPNGQYGDGDGYCSADEGRFKSGRGRQKLENDLRSTATTRAKNRATADLVGMGEVSAEELVPGGEDDEHAQALAAGARASDELARLAFAALARLLGGREPDAQAARRVGERIAYRDETVRSLVELVCDEGALQRLTKDQLGELAFLLECAVRGKVTGRSLEAWLGQLAESDDRRGAAETLRARLVEKTNDVELLGRREAA